MERSSRFISLSGWSGVSAGIFALVGAFIAREKIQTYIVQSADTTGPAISLKAELIIIAAIVFIAAFVSAIFFTYLKTEKDGVAVWSKTTRRLIWSTLLPMVAGGCLIMRMMDLGQYELIAAVSLICYGLGLVNGSKFTIGEVRYLGYAFIVTGVAGLWINRQGIYIWAFGFGILHIIYGISMWLKYDRRAGA